MTPKVTSLQLCYSILIVFNYQNARHINTINCLLIITAQFDNIYFKQCFQM